MIKLLKIGFGAIFICSGLVAAGGYFYWNGLKEYGQTSLGSTDFVEVTIKKSGEFCPFANDLNRFYGANAGRIKLKVTRLS